MLGEMAQVLPGAPRNHRLAGKSGKEEAPHKAGGAPKRKPEGSRVGSSKPQPGLELGPRWDTMGTFQLLCLWFRAGLLLSDVFFGQNHILVFTNETKRGLEMIIPKKRSLFFLLPFLQPPSPNKHCLLLSDFLWQDACPHKGPQHF